MPVSRIQKRLKRGAYAPRVGTGAAIFLTATIEYLCSELLDLAGNAATELIKKRITPRHIMMAIKHDDELSRLLKDVHVAHGGVLPNIVQILLYTIKERKHAQERNELPSDSELVRNRVPSASKLDIEKSKNNLKKKKKKRKSTQSESTPASQQF